jgi:lycopene cyclase domain-containing protein
VAYQILGAVSDENIEVDMIVQNVGEDGTADFTFTVHRNDYERSLELVRAVCGELRNFCGDRDPVIFGRACLTRQPERLLLGCVEIYAAWLPQHLYYLVHLVLWMLPIAVLQWVAFHKILRPHLKAIIAIPLALGTYLILTDMVAVHYGVWGFDDRLILGFNPGGVPIEEWLFFYLTALLCVQSFLLFLPEQDRSQPAAAEG